MRYIFLQALIAFFTVAPFVHLDTYYPVRPEPGYKIAMPPVLFSKYLIILSGGKSQEGPDSSVLGKVLSGWRGFCCFSW
jgi:hypothetical protein